LRTALPSHGIACLHAWLCRATGRRRQHYNALCLIDGLIALAGEHAPIPGIARSSPRSTPSRGCTIMRSKRKVVSSRMASKRGEPGRREKRSPAGSLARSLAGRSAIAALAIAALLWLAAPAAPAPDTRHSERSRSAGFAFAQAGRIVYQCLSGLTHARQRRQDPLHAVL